MEYKLKERGVENYNWLENEKKRLGKCLLQIFLQRSIPLGSKFPLIQLTNRYLSFSLDWKIWYVWTYAKFFLDKGHELWSTHKVPTAYSQGQTSHKHVLC